MLAEADASLEAVQSMVMIQCVGPAAEFCSRMCCTVALKNALSLKERNPDAQIVILYKDIRTYGFKERLYARARSSGVLFVRYDDEHPPEILNGEGLQVQAWDPQLHKQMLIKPDLLVVSMPVVPRPDSREVANVFKVSLDRDNFFQEAHVKLRPVDFASDGVFMAGLAHYPKFLDESMIQAQAAASRAARILSQKSLTGGGRVAVVEASRCTGCLTCVRICPFGVPQIQPDLLGAGEIAGAAHIDTTVCQGCGSCVAECPAQAIQLMHYTDAQMIAKVRALVGSNASFIPLEKVLEM